MMAYAISAFLPAVTGALYFFKSGVILPDQAFDLTMSTEAIVTLMLGGQGTVVGPAIGALVYSELRGYLLTTAAFSSFQLVIAGALLLIVVLFAPGGLMGVLYRWLPRLRRMLP
jgi:ABC-type branched-subunit amino acid transport system permease subunit